jgi:TonB family protein
MLLIALVSLGFLGAEQTPLIVEGHIPTYPQLAIQGRISGRVRVRFKIVGGTVAEAQVAYTDNRVLNDSTLQCVRSWRFDQSTNADLETEFVYEISKSEGGVPQNPALELRLPGYVRLVATPVRPITNFR